jgi:hypothetical protein
MIGKFMLIAAALALPVSAQAGPSGKARERLVDMHCDGEVCHNVYERVQAASSDRMQASRLSRSEAMPERYVVRIEPDRTRSGKVRTVASAEFGQDGVDMRERRD